MKTAASTSVPFRASSFRPIRTITAGVAVTLILFSVVGWYAWSTYQALAKITRDEVRLQELGGTILHLDEVLTMSARMASTTGDPRWEQRYQRYEPQLEAAISEAIELAPEAAEGEGAAKTETANVKLVEMEERAFELVRRDRRDAALTLLMSAAYEEQKDLYARSIGETLAAIRSRIIDQLEVHRGRFVAVTVSGATGTVVLFLVWLAILSRVRWHLREQFHAQRKIRRLNDRLEARVKERTAALQKSEAQWRSLVENVPSTIVMADRHGRISLVGKAPRGRLADEKIVGTNVQDHMKAEHREAVREAFERVFENHEAVTYESAEDASDEAQWYLNRIAPVEHDGAVEAAIIVTTDVTVVKQAQQRVEEQGRLLRSVLDNMAEGVIVADQEGRFIHWNPAAEAITGMGPTQLGAEEWARHYGLFSSDGTNLYPNAQLPLARAARGESVDGAEGLIRHPGKPEGVLWTGNARPLRDDAGNVRGGIVVFRDVTAERRAEEAAAQHQAELARVLRLTTAGEMAAGLAHELNQPLCAISNFAKGCVRRIENGVLEGEGLRYPVERIAAESLRAGRIIHNVLDFVRKGKPKKEMAELNDVVREAAQLAQAEARQQRVALRLDLASSLPRVSIDAIQIEQVILNLVRNAIEATAEVNGVREVWLSTTMTETDTLQIAVRDNGYGLPAGLERKLFEPFFTTKPSGLGMGLSISQSIVETHGGRVWATSNSDSGSTFSFTLPRHADALHS